MAKKPRKAKASPPKQAALLVPTPNAPHIDALAIPVTTSMVTLDWQTLDSCPKDHPVLMFCPGACEKTGNVLMGEWLERLGIWELMSYGTIQPTTLYPSMWAEIPPGPG